MCFEDGLGAEPGIWAVERNVGRVLGQVIALVWPEHKECKKQQLQITLAHQRGRVVV